ncbi:hypothetical protein BKI51_21110 [Alphaproteobacteria bacterium AO1-B]|nr:hypothetical protein BKI51_21110 [Alphaproteobacteria bacterium AO1-B]
MPKKQFEQVAQGKAWRAPPLLCQTGGETAKTPEEVLAALLVLAQSHCAVPVFAMSVCAFPAAEPGSRPREKFPVRRSFA